MGHDFGRALYYGLIPKYYQKVIIMYKTYSVHFIDGRDGYPNHKLLVANSEQDIYAYMHNLGHTVITVEEQ